MTSTSPLTLSQTMLRRHLSPLTVGWFSQRDLPPAALAQYDEHREMVWASARRAGDLPWFALALRQVLGEPARALKPLTTDCYSFSEAQSRELLDYVLAGAPAEAAWPGDVPAVELKEMDNAEWRALRATLPAPGGA